MVPQQFFVNFAVLDIDLLVDHFMESQNLHHGDSCPSTRVVDDAVGMKKWFIAIVRPNTEFSSQNQLKDLEFNAFVASQPEIRVWRNGRKKKVDRILIRARVFVECTESQRREIVKFPFILRFMTDRATIKENDFSSRFVVIPDDQMKALMFMLGHADKPVSFSEEYKKGEWVQVVRGKLKGLKGEVLQTTEGSSLIEIAIDFLGSARMQIDPNNLDKIPRK